VAVNFLGFGASDKPDAYHYSFAQQVGDLAAVVDELGLATVVPVAHDAVGPAAINLCAHPTPRVAWVGLLNCFYSGAPTLKFPEFIAVFATPTLRTRKPGR
jgi:haloalkane dehalogenase